MAHLSDPATGMNIENFYRSVWRSYVEVTPQAKAIHDLFTAHGETVVNDHVAFRTLSNSPVAIGKLETALLSLGFRRHADYVFEKKKLIAHSYIHRDGDIAKIFLSELQRDQLSAATQEILDGLVSQIPENCAHDPSIFFRGLLWRKPTIGDYRTLLQESEYAAWLATMGLRANHFTVSLNQLKHFADLPSVIALLKQHNHNINTAGGEIKGTPETRLEQAATLADSVWFEFADGESRRIPACFYEFARRYPLADGRLFQGFVTDNADRIFESTHATTPLT